MVVVVSSYFPAWYSTSLVIRSLRRRIVDRAPMVSRNPTTTHRGGRNIRDATSEIDLVHRETLSTKSNGSNLREMLFPRFLLLSLNHLPLQIYIYFHRFLLKSLRNWKLLVKRALLFSMKVIILGKGKEFQLLRSRIRSNKRAGIKYAFSIIVHCDSIARVRRTGRNGVIIVVIIMLRCFGRGKKFRTV